VKISKHLVSSYTNFHYDANGKGECSVVWKMFHHIQGLFCNSSKDHVWNTYVRYAYSMYRNYKFPMPQRLVSFLNSNKTLPFLELFEYAIFGAGIYSVDALQCLAWLPNARKVAPPSAKRLLFECNIRKFPKRCLHQCFFPEKKKSIYLLARTIRLSLYLPCKANKSHQHC